MNESFKTEFRKFTLRKGKIEPPYVSNANIKKKHQSFTKYQRHKFIILHSRVRSDGTYEKKRRKSFSFLYVAPEPENFRRKKCPNWALN